MFDSKSGENLWRLIWPSKLSLIIKKMIIRLKKDDSLSTVI